jgi:hypothetical protein
MMGDLLHALVLVGRHADDVEDKRALRLGAHHAVQGRELADAVGGRQHGGAPNARITVCRVRCIQFVGAADPLHRGAAVHGIADRKQIVTGNAEAVTDAFGGQALDDIVGDADCLRLS